MKKVLRLPYLPIIAVPLILFSPLIVGRNALFWGTPSLQFISWWDWAWETLRSGHLPLWNPLLGMGAPLLANYQSALFYPPNWTYFLLHIIGGTTLMAWGQAVLVVAHLIWAGIGMVLLTEKLGGGDVAKAVSGLSFSLSGYLVARAGFLSINAANAWLPWILYMGLVIARNPTSLSMLKWAVLIALQLLAGHAQTTYYTLILTGIWISYWAWQTVKEQALLIKIKRLLVIWGTFILSGGIAGMIAAVQLLPTFEYFLESHRASAVSFDFAMTYSFWPWRLLTLFAPDLFGNPAQGNYWGYANYWEDAIYIGVLPIILALSYLLRSLRRVIKSDEEGQSGNETIPSNLAIFLLAIILLSFILAFGVNTPIFPWLYRHIPTFSLFQAPTRFTLWAVFSFSLLAGLGVDRWQRPHGRGLYWTRLATAGAFAVAIGAGLSWMLLDSIRVTFIRAMALAGLWGAGVGVLSLLAPKPGNREGPRNNWWRWGVGIWVALDLLVAGWGLNPGVNLDFYGEIDIPRSRKERLYLPSQVEYEVKFEQFFQFDTFQSEAGWVNLRKSSLPNLNMLDGIAMVNNFDPLVPGRYQTWMEKMESNPSGRPGETLSLMGVGSVGTHPGGGVVNFHPVPDGGNFTRWVPCSRYVESGKHALDIVLNGKVDLEDYVILEKKRADLPNRCLHAEGEIMPRKRSPNLETYDVETEQPGWMLRSTVWYPGWKAYIDGVKVEIFRGDYLFQAVRIPEGEHELTFAYQPLTFRVGEIVTGLSVVGLMAGFLKYRRKHHSVGNKR